VAQFTIRSASPADAREMAELFAAVAEERTGIATEPPVDIEERASQWACRYRRDPAKPQRRND
jgi:hypothetical protein